MTSKTVNGKTVYIYTVAEIHGFIDKILCLGSGVTEWEQSFIKDMEGKSWYSEKQSEIIERIYSERTA
jgi:uncharacterized protein YgfB (UPF0149 family)